MRQFLLTDPAKTGGCSTMLETISEIGVLKERGDYDRVNKNARSEFEKYFGGD